MVASSPTREEKFTKVGGFLAPHRRHTTRRTARSTAGAGLRLQAGSRAGSGRMHKATSRIGRVFCNPVTLILSLRWHEPVLYHHEWLAEGPQSWNFSRDFG